MEQELQNFGPNEPPSQQQLLQHPLQHPIQPSLNPVAAQSRIGLNEEALVRSNEPWKTLQKWHYQLSPAERARLEDFAYERATRGETTDQAFERYFTTKHRFQRGPVWDRLGDEAKRRLLRSQIAADLHGDVVRPEARKQFQDKAFRLHHEEQMVWQNLQNARNRLENSRRNEQPPHVIEAEEGLVSSLEARLHLWHKQQEEHASRHAEDPHHSQPFFESTSGKRLVYAGGAIGGVTGLGLVAANIVNADSSRKRQKSAQQQADAAVRSANANERTASAEERRAAAAGGKSAQEPAGQPAGQPAKQARPPAGGEGAPAPNAPKTPAPNEPKPSAPSAPQAPPPPPDS